MWAYGMKSTMWTTIGALPGNFNRKHNRHSQREFLVHHETLVALNDTSCYSLTLIDYVVSNLNSHIFHALKVLSTHYWKPLLFREQMFSPPQKRAVTPWNTAFQNALQFKLLPRCFLYLSEWGTGFFLVPWKYNRVRVFIVKRF